MWRLYFQWNRLIEVLAYIFSMIYVIDDFQLDRKSFTILKGSRQVEFFLTLFFVSHYSSHAVGPHDLSKTKYIEQENMLTGTRDVVPRRSKPRV